MMGYVGSWFAVPEEEPLFRATDCRNRMMVAHRFRRVERSYAHAIHAPTVPIDDVVLEGRRFGWGDHYALVYYAPIGDERVELALDMLAFASPLLELVARVARRS